MSNTALARKSMVDSQVRVNDVTDIRVQAAMSNIERETFVPRAKGAAAYSDIDLQVSDHRFLMKPGDFAKMLQALEIKADDLVLDIGAATGYSSTVLAQLAETVVALEEDEELTKKAEKTIAMAGADNVAVINGPLCVGLPDQGPFDVIFVGGAVAKTPEAWLRQLADGGRLAVIENTGAVGVVKIYTRSGGVTGSRAVFDAYSPYLPGFSPAPKFTL